MAQHILIIEDDETIGKAFELVLSSEGYKVTRITKGKAGLEAAKTDKPDLILLDVLLPDTTGWEVFSELSKDEATKSIPVIIESNIYSADREMDFIGGGAKAYILKSKLDAPTLLAKVREFLPKA